MKKRFSEYRLVLSVCMVIGSGVGCQATRAQKTDPGERAGVPVQYEVQVLKGDTLHLPAQAKAISRSHSVLPLTTSEDSTQQTGRN